MIQNIKIMSNGDSISFLFICDSNLYLYTFCDSKTYIKCDSKKC